MQASNSTYTWMTQSWVVDLFLNCERSNYVADKRYGAKPLLQCPTPAQVRRADQCFFMTPSRMLFFIVYCSLHI